MDAYLVPLLDPKEIELLHPRLSDHHVAAVRKVERLSWDQALAILKTKITRDDPHGDVPFTMYLATADDPLPFARAWWDHLCEAHLELLPLSVTAFAIAAYGVAVSHALRVEHAEARSWARVGAETTEFERRPGLDLAVFVRAVRLLQPVLGRLRADEV